MKKTKAILTLSLVSVLLIGCSFDKIKSDAINIKDTTQEKIYNVKEEIDRVSRDVIETKEKIENKVDKGIKVLDAIDEFNKA